METVLLLLSCLSVGVLSLPNTFDSERVMGGTQATSGEFPYVVSISFDGQHFCGGFIYSDKWVVTAASCVYGKYPSQLKVTVGDWSLNSVDPGEQSVSVFSILIYEGYNNASKTNDIALIELATSITFGPYATLAKYDEVDESISYGTFMGWGATQIDGIPSMKLRKASLTISSDCLPHYTTDEFNKNYMICAGAVSSSPCTYDEGSPLVQKISNEDIAVGIMSKNRGCDTNGPPSIFTRLSVYYSWFQANAGLQPIIPTTVSTTIVSTSTVSTTTVSTTTVSTTTAKPTAPTAPCIDCVTASYIQENPYV